MLYYSPEPLCLLMFRLSPKWRIIRPQNLHYYRAKRCVIRLNPCIYWYSGYSPKSRIIRPQNLYYLRKNLCYSPKPLYLLMFRLLPQMVCYSLFSRVSLFLVHFYHTKRRIINAPKTCIIAAQNGVLLSWTLVFTGIQAIPPNGVLLPRKMLHYSPEPLYLLVFRLFPQMSYYSRKKVCYY